MCQVPACAELITYGKDDCVYVFVSSCSWKTSLRGSRWLKVSARCVPTCRGCVRGISSARTSKESWVDFSEFVTAAENMLLYWDSRGTVLFSSPWCSIGTFTRFFPSNDVPLCDAGCRIGALRRSWSGRGPAPTSLSWSSERNWRRPWRTSLCCITLSEGWPTSCRPHSVNRCVTSEQPLFLFTCARNKLRETFLLLFALIYKTPETCFFSCISLESWGPQGQTCCDASERGAPPLQLVCRQRHGGAN